MTMMITTLPKLEVVTHAATNGKLAIPGFPHFVRQQNLSATNGWAQNYPTLFFEHNEGFLEGMRSEL